MAGEAAMSKIQNNDPARGWAAITPSDTNDLPGQPCRGIYVGGAGNVAIDDAFGNNGVVFTAVPVGTFMPVCAKRVRATNTTATLLIALY